MKKIAVHVTLLAGTAFFGTQAFAQVLDEITVTATKREQSTQDIPMSVAAVSGDVLLQNAIQDLSDLAEAVPGLVITNSATNKVITMRGMGAPAGQRGTEQAVATFVDGVYKPRSKQYYSAFLDVDRIEVLRGPQAVLFGINATAGAISILSNSNRGGDELDASIRLENELEYGGLIATGIVGGGLTENFGARLALRHQDTDGFFDIPGSHSGDTEAFDGRLSLDWDISDSVSAMAKVDFFDVEWNGVSGEGLDPLAETADNEFAGPAEVPFANRAGLPMGFDMDGTNVTASLDWDVGGNTLSAIAGYSELDRTDVTDFDGGTAAGGVDVLTFESISYEDFEQYTFELRLASPGGEKIDYVVGVYAQEADLDQGSGAAIVSPAFNGLFYGTPADPAAGLVNQFAGSVIHTLDPNDPHNNPWGVGLSNYEQSLLSVYANVTINISDTLSLTVGARYNDEDRDFERRVDCGLAEDGFGGLQPESSGSVPCIAARLTDVLASGGTGGAFFNRPDGNGIAEDDWQHFLPEVSAMWDVSEKHRLYGRVALGAKSGGMSSSWATALADTQFEDETVVAVELGTKSRLMDGRAELNTTIFNNDYEDLQVTSFEFGSARVDNAGEATVRGIELDGRVAATEWLTLGGSLAYLDTEYDEYTNGTCADAPSPSRPNPDGVSCDLSGLPLINSPDFSGNVYGDVVVNLSDSIDLLFGANISYSDDYYTEANYITALKQDSYSNIGAYIGLASVDDKWSLSLVGKNLSDEETTGSGIEINALGLASVVPTGNSPRMVYINGQYNF